MALHDTKNLILREVQEAGDVEVEDLTSYALIFLSDGKPTDSTIADTFSRNLILNELASKLRSKLAFFAMGLGQSADFHALAAMVEYVKIFECEATFEYAQLSAAKLSHAFTSIATSMTATRVEMLSGQPVSTHKKKKDVALRSKHVPKAERRYQRYSREVSRWRYDHQKFEQHVYPWSKIPFKNDISATGFEMEDKPFGEGAERLAYMFYEIDRDGRRLGAAMVGKESNAIDSEERKLTFHRDFCRVQRKASELAVLFNKAIKSCHQLKPVESWMQLPQISFLKCHVYEYKASDGGMCGLLVEPYLKDRFTKYNGNNGYVTKRKSGSKIELAIGTVLLTDFLQGFSHWVYSRTNHQLLLCDLHGVLNEEGKHPRFELTDPCICLKKGPRYGKTDLRQKGIRSFNRTHRCNQVCKGLGLPSFGRKQN